VLPEVPSTVAVGEQEPVLPAAAPNDPPRRILFLSDCYAQDVVWGPFHKTMMAYCATAFEHLLAIRTNAFFHPWSHQPLSAEHLSCVQRAVRDFAPDLVFSINRAGLAGQVLDVLHPDVRVLTVFVDYYDRLDDSMHRYGHRDQVWATGTPKLRSEFLAKYAVRLRPDQVIHTLWGVDHNLFYPRPLPRNTGIIFVGTPFNPEGFVNLLDVISQDEHNRRVFLETYEAHREQFIYDWRGALRKRGFDFDRLPSHALPWVENFELQARVCDQISIENRITCLAALAGLDVHIFGDSNRQWVQDFSIAGGKALKHFQFRSITEPEELVHLYSSSKIGVNIQHDHARQHGLSFRVFDLMACKALLATHIDSKEVLDDLGFVEDEDYVCFSDPAVLRKKCEFYLAHENQRRAIAESGYQKVLSGHTLAHRFATVFDGFGYKTAALCYPRFCQGEGAALDATTVLREKVKTLETTGVAQSADVDPKIVAQTARVS
jgi:hypothetical protein